MMLKTNYQTRFQTCRVSRRNVIQVRAAKSFDISEFVEKKKQLDKKRLDRVKEIGASLDQIARNEVKQSAELVNEYLPFLDKVKDWKIEKKDIEDFINKMKPSSAEKKSKKQDGAKPSAGGYNNTDDVYDV